MRLLVCILKEKDMAGIIIGAAAGYISFITLKKAVSSMIISGSLSAARLIAAVFLPFAVLGLYAFIDSSGLIYAAVSMTSVIIFYAFGHYIVQNKARKKNDSESAQRKEEESSDRPIL